MAMELLEGGKKPERMTRKQLLAKVDRLMGEIVREIEQVKNCEISILKARIRFLERELKRLR